MTKLLITYIFLLCPAFIQAQDSLTIHTVQRGETFELIANKYGVTLEELKEANPDEEFCYTGMELDIPIKVRPAERNPIASYADNTMDVEHSSKSDTSVERHIVKANKSIDALYYYTTGVDFFKKKKYKKAANEFTKAIGILPMADFYIARGKSNLNRNKYKKAISDFESAKRLGGMSPDNKEACDELLTYARQQREAQLERKSQLWAGVAGAVLMTGAAVMQAKAQSSASRGNTSPNLGFKRNTSLDYLIDPQYTMQQFAIQEQQEYMMAKQYRPDLTLEQYRMEKGRAIQQLNTGAGGFSSGASPSYSSENISSSNNSCLMCHGTGTISKETWPPSFGISDNTKERCNECGKYFLKRAGHVHVPCTACHGR